MRASPCCSQVLGFSQLVAMADAVHGWPCGGFGYVHAAGSSGVVGQEIPSAWPLIFLLLLTNAQACSVGYPSCWGHVIQAGSIVHIAVCVLLLVFVLTGLKLTPGCLTAIPLPPRSSEVRIPCNYCHSHPNGMCDLISGISCILECFPGLDELFMLMMLSCRWIW